MFALSPRQRLAPFCRGAGACRRFRRRGPGRDPARQARSHIGAGAHRGTGTTRRFPAVDPDWRALSAAHTERSAATPPDPGGLARSARSTGAAEAGLDAVRGRPLGRCDLARGAQSDGRTRPRLAGIRADHLPAGIRGTLDRPLARDQHSARPPGTRRGRDPSRARRRPAAAARGDGADRRQDRRCPALCRGIDQGGAGIRPARRGAARLAPRRAIAALRHSGDVAGFVGGAARSAGAGQGDRANRRRDRPRILLPAAARGRRSRRAGIARGTDAARRGGAAVPLGRAARCALHLQARAGPGHSLRNPAQEPAADAAPADRRCLARRVRGGRCGRTGTRGPSSDPGRSRRAGDRMVGESRRSGLAPLGIQEAAAHLGKAIELADKPAASAASGSNRLHLQTRLGNALIWARGYQAPETSAAFARARELASREEDASERFSAYYGLWVGHLTRCEPASLREMAELFLREATGRPDCPEALIAHRISGATCFHFGDFAAAHDHFQKTVELYDPARHADFANRFGSDTRAAAHAYDALALWVLGQIDDSLQLADRALADAESAAHPPTMGQTLLFAAYLGILRYNPETVATYSQALADIASRYDLPVIWAGHAVFFQ